MFLLTKPPRTGPAIHSKSLSLESTFPNGQAPERRSHVLRMVKPTLRKGASDAVRIGRLSCWGSDLAFLDPISRNEGSLCRTDARPISSPSRPYRDPRPGGRRRCHRHRRSARRRAGRAFQRPAGQPPAAALRRRARPGPSAECGQDGRCRVTRLRASQALSSSSRAGAATSRGSALSASQLRNRASAASSNAATARWSMMATRCRRPLRPAQA